MAIKASRIEAAEIVWTHTHTHSMTYVSATSTSILHILASHQPAIPVQFPLRPNGGLQPNWQWKLTMEIQTYGPVRGSAAETVDLRAQSKWDSTPHHDDYETDWNLSHLTYQRPSVCFYLPICLLSFFWQDLDIGQNAKWCLFRMSSVMGNHKSKLSLWTWSLWPQTRVKCGQSSHSHLQSVCVDKTPAGALVHHLACFDSHSNHSCVPSCPSSFETLGWRNSWEGNSAGDTKVDYQSYSSATKNNTVLIVSLRFSLCVCAPGLTPCVSLAWLVG